MSTFPLDGSPACQAVAHYAAAMLALENSMVNTEEGENLTSKVMIVAEVGRRVRPVP